MIVIKNVNIHKDSYENISREETNIVLVTKCF